MIGMDPFVGSTGLPEIPSIFFGQDFPNLANIDEQTPALLSFWIYCNIRHLHSGYSPNMSPLDPLGTFEDEVPFPWGGMIY